MLPGICPEANVQPWALVFHANRGLTFGKGDLLGPNLSIIMAELLPVKLRGHSPDHLDTVDQWYEHFRDQRGEAGLDRILNDQLEKLAAGTLVDMQEVFSKRSDAKGPTVTSRCQGKIFVRLERNTNEHAASLLRKKNNKIKVVCQDITLTISGWHGNLVNQLETAH